ncbi:hypothetical protein MNBD_GAMMA24-2284 [hydrothermal vent metagenome]|uniref:Toxin CptA n=1 Tax=hydrothermal vent metagenome TaxID=652676 RepID=A0A3B1C6V8_9ZZZZ
MSHKKYRQPLDLKPRGSRHLLLILLVVHLLAVFALFLPTTLPWYGRSIILLAIILSAWSSLYKARFKTIKSACWKRKGNFDLELLNGKHRQADLLAGSLVTEWLIILHLACADGRKRKWLILPDMIDHETYRRLCVRLRQWHADTDAQADR